MAAKRSKGAKLHMPRAPRTSAKKRDKRQVVNMNREEKVLIEEGARMDGISVSGYLIKAGLEKRERMKEQKRAEKIAREFAAAATSQSTFPAPSLELKKQN